MGASVRKQVDSNQYFSVSTIEKEKMEKFGIKMAIKDLRNLAKQRPCFTEILTGDSEKQGHMRKVKIYRYVDFANIGEIKTVFIPAGAEHCGCYGTRVKLRWICPKCGKPRGEIQKVRSYDGSAVLFCDGWSNDCGHVDKYDDVRKEARLNGLNGGGYA